MKKIIALLCVVVLSLSLLTVAFAAPSSPFPITSTSGTVKAIAQSDTPAGVENTANAVQTAINLGVKNTTGFFLLTAFDFSGTPGAQNLTIQGAANRRVVILHYYNSAWEVAYNGYADGSGTIYFSLSAFSPCAILLGNTAGTDTTSDTVSAPKTADSSHAVLLGTTMICCLAGACYVLKRAKA